MEEMTPTPQTVNQSNQYLIPGAIVIAGAFIAGALFFSNTMQQPTKAVAGQPTAEQEEVVDTSSAVRKVTSEDHIKGNPDAPIKIVEYSDFECPFCIRFHDTMNAVMDKYGDSGEVAWVFRQLPLEAIHPVKARAVAVATECAAELGGNDSFWKFADRYMELSLGNNQTAVETVIPQIVREVGLNESKFQECFESGRHDARIEADMTNAAETGGRGTPWSILIGPDGSTYPINGAQPIGAIEQLITIAKKAK